MRPALAATLLLALAAPARAGAGLPVAVRSVQGGFEARFPSTPDPATGDAAGRRLHALEARGDAGTSYALIWSDHVPEAVRARDEVCRGELERLVAAGALRLRDEPAMLGGLDGRAFEAALPDGSEIRGRVAMRGVRTFMLLVTGAARIVDRDAMAFFLAFALRGEGLPDPPTQAATRRVRIREAGVSFELEGPPRHEEGDVPHGFRSLFVVSRGGLRVQRVYYLPAPMVPLGRDELLLGAASESIVRAGATIRERRELTWRGRPAREIRVSLPHEDAWLRTVVLDDGALTLVLSGMAGTLTRRDAAAFFDTLVVGDGSEPGS